MKTKKLLMGQQVVETPVVMVVMMEEEEAVEEGVVQDAGVVNNLVVETLCIYCCIAVTFYLVKVQSIIKSFSPP
eukprot:snap_masked-scaffold_51-processed-gene-1.39-mRNA-1 protein AED:1.00 eAED:1.00 QI:0/0/0/0/1/1/2/0/73